VRVSDKHGAAFYCRLSLRERMEERYFRAAKGDNCLPQLPNQSIRDDSPPNEPARDFASSGLSILIKFVDVCLVHLV